MSTLAFDSEGEPIDVPPSAVAWQVRRPQPRVLPPGPDFDEIERSAGQDRQRERRPQDLPAAFAVGAVEFDHDRPPGENNVPGEE